MKKYFAILSLITVFLSPSMSYGGEALESLKICVADNINGKERKDVAKWMYFAISQHSTLKPYTTVTSKDVQEQDQSFAKLLTRLLSEDCRQFTKAAFVDNGPSAFEEAGGVLGEIAMLELMREEGVLQAFVGYTQFLDSDSFTKALN